VWPDRRGGRAQGHQPARHEADGAVQGPAARHRARHHRRRNAAIGRGKAGATRPAVVGGRARGVRGNRGWSDDDRDRFGPAQGGRSRSPARDRTERTGEEEPAPAELDSAREGLVTYAITQLRRAEVRQKLEDLQAEAAEQLIHVGGHDTLIDAGYVDDGRAAELVDSWREFIEQHHDDYEALRAYYSEPYRRRPSWRDIKELARAIEKPPMNLTPQRLWTAYEQLEGSRVKGAGGRVLTDLVQLVRYALERDDELRPRERSWPDPLRSVRPV